MDLYLDNELPSQPEVDKFSVLMALRRNAPMKAIQLHHYFETLQGEYEIYDFFLQFNITVCYYIRPIKSF